mmetsp:Transcript_19385/g.51742  ORF Transcript_19385/g.51742 Transcript_19385/m.51742 type:complete len:228 (+) Transcript_19385:1505-2188(+)
MRQRPILLLLRLAGHEERNHPVADHRSAAIHVVKRFFPSLAPDVLEIHAHGSEESLKDAPIVAKPLYRCYRGGKHWVQLVLSTARVETLPEVRDELLKVLPSHIAGFRGVHVVIRHTRNAVQRRCVEQHAKVHQGRSEEVGATVDIQQAQTDKVRAHRGRRDDRESKTKHCQDRDHTEVQLMVVPRVSNVFTDLGISNRVHCRQDNDNLRRNLHQRTGCAVNQLKPI